MLNKVQTLQARRPERTARVQCLLQSLGIQLLTLFSLIKKKNIIKHKMYSV
jgi:hypothetical protein